MELNKKTMQRIMLLITFAVLLFWGLYNISAVTKVLGKLLDLLSPLLLGICIAFVLNLMMAALERLWDRALAKWDSRWNRKLKRPVCLALTMVLFIGIIFGFANIIPGVSGGTMAVSLGIYDRLIGAVSGLFKEFKKNIAFLIPIIIGCGIGIVGFTYAIEYLLDKHTFVTCMAFVGLILGGLPAIISSMKSKMTSGGIGVFGILAFVIAFVISGGMPLLKESKDALTVIAVTPVNMVILFILGVVASATMVIPGVSGSMMLMIFGYYYAIINTIKTFLDNLRAFDLMGMKDGILLLAPFGIGVILGIFLIAKLITFLFEKYGVQTFCAILGLVISSPIAIFINTGLVSKLGSLSIWEILFGIVLMGAGAFVTVFVGEK